MSKKELANIIVDDVANIIVDDVANIIVDDVGVEMIGKAMMAAGKEAEKLTATAVAEKQSIQSAAKVKFLDTIRRNFEARMPKPIADQMLAALESQVFKDGAAEPNFANLGEIEINISTGVEMPIRSIMDSSFSIVNPFRDRTDDIQSFLNSAAARIPLNEMRPVQLPDGRIFNVVGNGGMANASNNKDYVNEAKTREMNRQLSQKLAQLTAELKEATEILERVQKEATIIYTIERMSKDRKYAFIKKMDQEIRIEACKNLKIGDEVALNAKTMQIVEHLGAPPLEASRFAPEKVPNVTWADIGGLEEAKANMIEAIEMPHKHKELFAHYAKRQIKGILLSGPPGCGKTMLGKAAARSLADIYGKESAHTGFLYVKGPEILDQFVGQSEKCIRDLFADARRHKEEHGYPAIIFLDEADSILAMRGRGGMGLGNTIVPQFLAEMDGLESSAAIVIIATNRPDVLDPAIVRDGRCDRKVTVKRPSERNAVTIIKMNLAKVPLAEGEKLDAIADAMAETIYNKNRMVREGVALSSIVTGAMLANCVDIATSFAVKRDIAGNTKTGLTLDDALGAIDMVQSQGGEVQHELEVTFSMNVKDTRQ